MYCLALAASLFTLLPSILALTITSPTASTIDPTQPFTITWTSTSSDPSTLEFNIHQTNPSVLATDEVLANGVATSLGSFTVPANTVPEFGTGFVIQALSGGNVIATSAQFALAAGQNAVSTLTNGQVTFVSVTTTPVASAPIATAPGSTAAQTSVAQPGSTAAASSVASGAGSSGETSGSSSTTNTRKSGSQSSSRPTTSATVASASSSSTGAAVATSTALAVANAKAGAWGIVGGLMGALAVLV